MYDSNQRDEIVREHFKKKQLELEKLTELSKKLNKEYQECQQDFGCRNITYIKKNSEEIIFFGLMITISVFILWFIKKK